jgi:hypothetical protein
MVVLINRLAESRFWYTDIHLGPSVSTAICRAYRQSGAVGDRCSTRRGRATSHPPRCRRASMSADA